MRCTSKIVTVKFYVLVLGQRRKESESQLLNLCKKKKKKAFWMLLLTFHLSCVENRTRRRFTAEAAAPSLWPLRALTCSWTWRMGWHSFWTDWPDLPHISWFSEFYWFCLLTGWFLWPVTHRVYKTARRGNKWWWGPLIRQHDIIRTPAVFIVHIPTIKSSSIYGTKTLNSFAAMPLGRETDLYASGCATQPSAGFSVYWPCRNDGA